MGTEEHEIDDWMHPRTSFSWQSPPPKNGTFFQIQRKRATPVSGNVSHIYSWDVFEECPTKEARNERLAKLREEHPMWQLRGRTRTFVNGMEIGGDPFENRDD